jgi:hypothetical protein
MLLKLLPGTVVPSSISKAPWRWGIEELFTFQFLFATSAYLIPLGHDALKRLTN